MSTPPHHTAEDIEVLREMIRLAERRRDEEQQMIERINQYNLALIAFAGGFLSFIITSSFEKISVETAGFFLIFSIFFSLLAIRPRQIKASIVISDDVNDFRRNQKPSLYEFLLTTAELTDQCADRMNILLIEKKKWTIFSAILIAISLGITYALHIYYA